MAHYTDNPVHVLRSIVSQNPRAKKELDKLCKYFFFNISTEFSFNFYGKKDWSDFCDCWFINEYFEYIDGSEINIPLFENVLENIARGRCSHVSQHQTENILKSSVSLIHAATAADNKEVVKYLIDADYDQKTRRTGIAGLLPLALTVLKDRHGLVKLVSDHLRFLYRGGEMLLAKRKIDCSDCLDVTVPRTFFDTSVIVLSFFSNAVPSRKTIGKLVSLIRDFEVTQALRYVIFEHNRKTCAEIVDSFASYIKKFCLDLVLEAIIWNKPEALKTIIGKGLVYDLYFEFGRTDLSNDDLHMCRILGHNECLDIINHSWPKKVREMPETSTISPYTYLMMFFRQASWYNIERFLSLFRIIAQKGFNVNQADKIGMTPAHYAIEYITDATKLSDTINCLCQMGCDVNKRDVNGRTLLFISLNPYNSPLGFHRPWNCVSRSLRIVKDILYHNAVPICTSMAVFYAIECDKTNKLLDYVHDNTVSVAMRERNQSGTETEISAETSEDKYLALSFVAILLELGFKVGHLEERLLSSLPEDLENYLRITMSVPKNLKAICRNAIRAAFPGPQLQRYLDSSRIPEAIANFILAKPYLLRTVIVSRTDTIMDDSFSRR